MLPSHVLRSLSWALRLQQSGAVSANSAKWLGLLGALAVCATTSTARAETLTLAQAIEMGLSKSPTLRGARARTASADASVTAAQGGYWPRFDGTITAGSGSFQPMATGSVTDTKATGFPTQTSRAVQYTYGIRAEAGLRWTLWDFGKTSNNVGASEAGLRGAAANEKESVAQTSALVANAYLTLFHQEKLLEVAKATLSSREDLFKIAKGLVKAGIQPPVEELRSEARFEGAQRDFARARAEAEQARMSLAIVLGHDTPTALRVVTPKLPRISLELNAAMKEAEQRPAITAADQAYEFNKSRADATAAQYFPTLSAQGTLAYSYSASDPPSGTNVRLDQTTELRSGTGSIVLGGPLWDPSQSAAVDKARADAAAAEASIDDTKRDVKSEAARSAIQVKLGQAQLEHARLAEERAGQVRMVIEERYKRGLSNPLELIDAEDSDLSARISRIQTELDYQLAIVRLCVATGRPIVDDADKPSKSSKDSP